MAFLKRSPWILHYDASSCNGCDIEVLACLTPLYDVERFGIINTGNPKHADILLITGGVKSWSVVSALQEAGLEVVGTSVKKSTPEDKQRIREIMGEDAHLIENMKPREMYAMLSEARADIMLSGGRTQFVALKARMPWLDINQERHYAYAGYAGIVNLVREIDKTINNPVWAAVRRPAPWESVAGEGQ